MLTRVLFSLLSPLFLRLWVCILCLSTGSCCYTVLSNRCTDVSERLNSTFYIAGIPDDEQGILQATIITELIKRNYRFCPDNSKAYLNITVTELKNIEESTGFTFAPQTQEQPKRRFLVSNESKLISCAVITVKNPAGVIITSFTVELDAYYDFQPDLGVENYHNFALGQFEMHGEAYKTAQQTVYRQLGTLIAQRVFYELT
ncbi:MAG: hypothetical protein RSB82_01025 [Victivallaceae bacterium]